MGTTVYNYKEFQFGSMIGKCEKIKAVFRLIKKIACNEDNVLIYGETGTGKEFVAKEIHKRSKRCLGPFVTINISAIPETLLESECFGYEKGAFTGAHSTKK